MRATLLCTIIRIALEESMLIEFEDTENKVFHGKFQTWRSKNLDGFFINCRSRIDLMLHRVPCSHPGNMKWQDIGGFGSLTKKKKVCSENIAELEQWARDDEDAKLRYCKDCFPDGKPT
jgi:hypothetical protein